MTARRGERWGWIGGWLGGFVWLALLAVGWLVRGKLGVGLLGLALFALAVVLIAAVAPWRRPRTPYWKLLLPLYAVLVAAVALAVWAEGGAQPWGISPWSMTWLFPMLIPLIVLGRRRWIDGASAPQR